MGRVFTPHPSVWLVPGEAEPLLRQAALDASWDDAQWKMNKLLNFHV